jgi:ABC-type lipoprotein export system ATPase subunit
MPNNISGSIWKKWDLHVHTPESFVHNYPGEKEIAWEVFLSDLEKLPSEFKVLGINDYCLVDGYERVLKAKLEHGRLSNIDLILPVVELRLDKFGGVVQRTKDGYEKSSWSRINLHVIFDQIDPDLIRQQFISAIGPNYSLVPGSSGQGKWNGVITRQSLELLGKAIIDSAPEDKRSDYDSPILEGFHALNVSFVGLKKALENQHLAGKFILAIGKTEWDNLKWDDHSIAEKKTVINDAHIVFTAAESPDAYAKARKRLLGSAVNANLLDCSDAHWLSNSDQKDRIGNCFTWIKADSTFQGLLQAIEEFDNRVYVGDTPLKKEMVDQNKTKFIRSVKVEKKADSLLRESWFDVEIPLNPDLVAIIGNKGSGKSALSDIIALAGRTKNFKGFSFLQSSRFRSARAKYAQHFVGELSWHDGSITQGELDKDPELSSVERVKYLPQSYLETLCNELDDGGSVTFDAELRKIIYSHVPEENRLKKSSMDELLNFKVAEINHARQSVRQEIAKVNADIIEMEKRSTLEFKKSLEEQLATKKAALSSLEATKLDALEDPNVSPEAQTESKQAAEHIEKLEQQGQILAKEEASLRDKKAVATKKQAVANRIVQALANHKKRHELFIEELNGLMVELDEDIPVEHLAELRVQTDPINLVVKEKQEVIVDVDNKLQSVEPGSLLLRRQELADSIRYAKSKLDERQRQFVRYKEELAKQEKMKLELIGTTEKAGSISWLESEIEGLAVLPQQLEDLRAKRVERAKELHKYIEAMVNEYRRLYEPVQGFVKSAEQMEMNLPLDFEVRIEEVGFQDQFLGRINRQARGTFSGVEESAHRVRILLQESDFSTADQAVAFAERIDEMLHNDYRDDKGNETKLVDQLRKGVDPQEVLDYLFGLEYLAPRYSLTYNGQEIGQLSPGERGLLLLAFYLLVDKDDIPIVIDQPEENLDNQTIFKVLVKCIKKAKERRQVIMVTHNPNLAVVCDAEQIIYASCDKVANRFDYEAGAIENPKIKARVIEILEGTEPAFKNRQSKYRLS